MLASFFVNSLAGVILDVLLFQLLSQAGVAPLYCNLVSAGVALTTTYFLVSKHTFGAQRNLFDMTVFVAWYSFSIFMFSLGIDYCSRRFGLMPILCKIGSLPFSFAVNFVFSRLFLGRAVQCQKK
ncbi:GtrA family protein [Silvimonas amylolytica]|uniref:GtrA family protein n=1 Tax=Silvimonas amylolytica TaxID=449663 RepID=UPI001E6354A7|nr:GtrA family protein [Silvimonas amylolytica]